MSYPLCKDGGRLTNKSLDMITQQMELGIRTRGAGQHPRFNRSRQVRLRFWFNHLKKVVAETPEWPTTHGGTDGSTR